MIKCTVQDDKQTIFLHHELKLLRIPIHDTNQTYNKQNTK